MKWKARKRAHKRSFRISASRLYDLYCCQLYTQVHRTLLACPNRATLSRRVKLLRTFFNSSFHLFQLPNVLLGSCRLFSYFVPLIFLIIKQVITTPVCIDHFIRTSRWKFYVCRREFRETKASALPRFPFNGRIALSERS